MTSPTPQTTDFTRDVLGRYICNGLDEALAAAEKGFKAWRVVSPYERSKVMRKETMRSLP